MKSLSTRTQVLHPLLPVIGNNGRVMTTCSTITLGKKCNYNNYNTNTTINSIIKFNYSINLITNHPQTTSKTINTTINTTNSTSTTTFKIPKQLLFLARSGKVQKVLEFISKNNLEKDKILHTLMLAYSKNGNLKQTEFLFRLIENPTMHCYTILLGLYFIKEKYDKVISLFNKIYLPDIACYIVLLRTFIKTGQIEQINFYYEKILKELKLIESDINNDNNVNNNVKDNNVNKYNIKMNSVNELLLNNERNVKEVYEYLKDIFKVISATFMNYYLKKRNFNEIDKIFNNVNIYLKKEEEKENNESKRRIIMNIYNCYLQSLILRNSSLQIINEFVEKNIKKQDVVTVHLLMIYFSKLQLFDKVEELYLKHGKGKNIFFETFIMRVYFNRKMYDKVEEIYKQIKNPDYKCNLLMIKSYLLMNKLDEVIQLFQSLPDSYVTDEIVNEMMKVK
ncbi:hypothetical protein ABK040_001081 [Willaertia magna]